MQNPLVISSLAGILISFLGFNQPIFLGIKKSVAMLGATASPIALFTLGAFLYGRFLKKNLAAVALSSILKMIVFPVFIFIASFYFLKTKDVKVFSLLGSMPVAVTTFVIAEKYNLNETLIGNAIILSTILSFVIAPLMIYLFS
ncbi:AEC family transporter [Candidatus Wolfebacteria bacterium]|nr:AEC family transporter [Candidatus Wolfebacteria bacterium]